VKSQKWSGVLAELGSTPIAPFVAAFPQGKKDKDGICDLKLVVYFQACDSHLGLPAPMKAP